MGMKYYSTNKNSTQVSFKEATIRGQAPDKGLYFPETIPQADKGLIGDIERISNEEIAFRVIKPYVTNEINDDDLFRIVSETIDFPIPLVKLNNNIFSLELFHGPTLAFKDIGARFMSRCLGHFLKNESKKVTVLVATSGDTGGAVANGFYGVTGVDVIILYPSGKVSPVQEKQLTTPGKNIKAVEVEGNFDDCQQMVKQAFADKEVNKRLFLTSANSINVARWLPQQFYYFFAYKQWADKDHAPVISVPSGNFGNICAGILAKQSGLPVHHFIAACNVNDSVTKYLQTEIFQAQTAVATLSNAMDVGNPSNFIRILEIFHHQFPDLARNLSSYSISDEETLATIKDVYERSAYLLDPHGAVGYLSLKRFLEKHPGRKGIFLETAHPVKFPGAVEEATSTKINMPSSLSSIMEAEKKSVKMKASYELFKNFLLD
jgi:threonine synthase